jgi:hypothetical protein
MRRLASNVSNNLRLIPQLFVSPLALLGAHDVNSDMNHKFANRRLWDFESDPRKPNFVSIGVQI